MRYKFVLLYLAEASLLELLLFVDGHLPFKLELTELRDPYLKF
jgi:hypothetical protein